MKIATRTCLALVLLSAALLPCRPAAAQNDEAEPAEAAETTLPEIPDEPKTVDPATLMPEKLATPVTVEFADSALTQVAEWVTTEQEITTLLDENELSDAGLLVSEPVSDRLDGDPVYLLLNRLSSLGLAWYLENDILHITTQEAAEDRLTTAAYTVGDLFDQDYDPAGLINLMMHVTSGPWFDLDGTGGTIQAIGDVLFVRHTHEMQREISGVLAALRKHGRMTFVYDPPQHEEIRASLSDAVSVEFDDTPLIEAVRELGESAGADIRLDRAALRAARIRDREPITLSLADRELGTVLGVLLSKLNLRWILRDGVLWVTTKQAAEEFQKTAVFDVTDLAVDGDEGEALMEAVQHQTGGPWFDLDGVGGQLDVPKPGVLVVRQTESELRRVLGLLEAYRYALRQSKPRDRDGVDLDEVITRYYRMPSVMSRDLETMLPVLVSPETWKSDDNPEADGSITSLASEPELRKASGAVVSASEDDAANNAMVVAHSVLIVTQSRKIHEEIAVVISRIKSGDTLHQDEFSGGGGGYGGGGFGGGFFSTKPAERN